MGETCTLWWTCSRHGSCVSVKVGQRDPVGGCSFWWALGNVLPDDSTLAYMHAGTATM